jgi:hypothetical protein
MDTTLGGNWQKSSREERLIIKQLSERSIGTRGRDRLY